MFFGVLKAEDAAWAFSCIAVVAVLVPLLLACEQQHVDEIQAILRTLLQMRFVVSHASESKIQHLNLIEPLSVSRIGY